MEKENFNVKVSNKIIEILDRDMETFNQKNRNSMINKIIFTYLKIKNEDDIQEKILNDIKKSLQGTSIKGITKNEIISSKIIIPKVSEQNKIGSTLFRIDSLITLHQRKLEKLKNIKKSLLEKMFVWVWNKERMDDF